MKQHTINFHTAVVAAVVVVMMEWWWPGGVSVWSDGDRWGLAGNRLKGYEMMEEDRMERRGRKVNNGWGEGMGMWGLRK